MPRVTAVQLSNIIASKQRQIIARGRQITEEMGQYGAELVRDTVETSGTVSTGKRGRIDTGAMLQSVDSEYQDTADGGEAVYGFLNEPFYTGFQELGTEYIEPMFAIPDAADNVEIDYKKALDKMLAQEWGN